MKSEIDSFQHFSVMERGASHKEKNMPLQDFASSLRGECSDKENKTINYVIASISDGHGSSQHFRSDRGAKFACEAVKEAFCEFMEKAKDFSSDKNQNKLKDLIYSKWYEMVIEDISDKPFKENDINIIDKKDEQKEFQRKIDILKKYSYDVFKKVERKLKEYKQAEKQLKDFGIPLKDDFEKVKKLSKLYLQKEIPFEDEKDWQGYNKYYENIKGTLNYLLTAYGCTLISVLSCDKFTLAVQIGDGSCVAFYKDGSCNAPIPEDKKNMANITTSLCRQRPDECRIHIFKERPVAVFVTSDGIVDSYGTGESLFNFYRHLCVNFSEEGINFKNDLQNRLSEISSKGSKDDISISGIYDECELSKLKDVIKKRYEKGVYQARLNAIEDENNDYNINSLKSKLKDMENKEEKRKEEIQKSNKILEFLRDRINQFKNWFSTKFKSEKAYEKWKDEKISELYEISKEIKGLRLEIHDLFEKLNEKEEKLDKKEEEFDNLNNKLKECNNKISEYTQNLKKRREQEENIADLEKENEEQKQKYKTYKDMYDKFKEDKEKNLKNKTNYESKIRELDEEINELLKNIGNTENFEIPEELLESTFPSEPINQESIYPAEPINQENTSPTEPINQESIYPAEPINQESISPIEEIIERIMLKKEAPQLNSEEYKKEDTNDEQAIEERRKNTNIDVQ